MYKLKPAHKSLQKHIVARQVIKKGEKFSLKNLTTKRTGGLGEKANRIYDILGMKSKENYKKDDIIFIKKK